MPMDSTSDVLRVIISIFTSLPEVIIAAMFVVGYALLFIKASDRWWKALIPYYNEITMLKHVGKKKWIIPYVICKVISQLSIAMLIAAGCILFFELFKSSYDVDIELMIIILFGSFVACFGCSVVCLIERIMRNIGLCNKLGVSAGYVVGLIFLEPIFLLILGGSSKFQWIDNNIEQLSFEV